MSDGGKGSKPRPFSVDQATYAANWERALGRAKQRPATEEEIQRSVVGGFEPKVKPDEAP